MRSQATSWLLVAAIALGVVACSSRGMVPGAASPGAAVPAAGSAIAGPDVNRCATSKDQPGWIFLGACASFAVPKTGTTMTLPSYKNYAVAFKLPPNGAAKGARVLLVDATGVKDVTKNAGRAFPPNGKAFLYLQTVDRGQPVVFGKGRTVRLEITSTHAFPATQCGVYSLASAADGDAAAGLWVKIDVKATPHGKTLVFSIPVRLLPRIPHGAAYFSISCAQAPNPVPAYCSNYTIPASATVPLNITDDSGLGGILLVYVTNGTNFLDNSGNFDDATANPYPAACFSTTSGSSGTQALLLPAGTTGGRIYFAYATPIPNQPDTVPNPMNGVSASGPSFGYGVSPYPYDKIEYGLTAGATIDTTQVDALGLPLELSVTASLPPTQSVRPNTVVRRGFRPHAMPTPCATSAPGIVGVTSCNFANIFTAMEAISPYNQLVLTQPYNGQTIDMQIVSPSLGGTMGFQLNMFALPSFAPSPQPAQCPSAPSTYGYLSCVLSAYQTTPELYESSQVEGVIGVSGDNYCAGSDGSSNFTFTDVGPATSCGTATPNPSVSPNPFDMPVQEFTYGVPPGSTGCTQNILFGQPWGNAYVGAGQLFATADAFAMWKALGVDLNRGAALSALPHPVGGSSPSMSLFFGDPLFNEYAYLIHYYFNNNLAYALAFDDSGGFESGVTWNSGDPINVRINAVPTATSVTPAATPSPLPVPSPCPPLPLNV
jgi:hypothetical protein